MVLSLPGTVGCLSSFVLGELALACSLPGVQRLLGSCICSQRNHQVGGLQSMAGQKCELLAMCR